jgi:hypothetical protein
MLLLIAGIDHTRHQDMEKKENPVNPVENILATRRNNDAFYTFLP